MTWFTGLALALVVLLLVGAVVLWFAERAAKNRDVFVESHRQAWWREGA